MDENINNLFNFYREAGATSSASLIREKSFSVVCGKNDSWPQMVFDVKLSESPSESLSQVLTETTNRNLPGFAVCNALVFGPAELDFLRDAGIYPVTTWILMDAKRENFHETKHAEDIRLKKLNTVKEIHAFTDLMHEGFAHTVKITNTLLEEFLANKSIDFYGLRIDDVLVSSLLAFSDQKVTGLYFIVTRPEFRGKGYAAELIRFAMEKSFRKTGRVVLQAVQKAVPLYEKLGFTANGKLVIFWKR